MIQWGFDATGSVIAQAWTWVGSAHGLGWVKNFHVYGALGRGKRISNSSSYISSFEHQVAGLVTRRSNKVTSQGSRYGRAYQYIYLSPK